MEQKNPLKFAPRKSEANSILLIMQYIIRKGPCVILRLCFKL